MRPSEKDEVKLVTWECTERGKGGREKEIVVGYARNQVHRIDSRHSPLH